MPLVNLLAIHTDPLNMSASIVRASLITGPPSAVSPGRGMETTGGDVEAAAAAVAHVLVFPFPAQGHMTGMLKLAELLSLSGLNVTFLSSDYNHRRILSFSGSYPRLSQLPSFRFRSIPDGLREDHPRSGPRFMDLEESMRTRSRAAFRDLLLVYKHPQDGWPPVTCAIIDGLMMFAIDEAEGMGIPAIAFRTSSSCSFLAYYSIPDLFRNGELPFPDDDDLDEPVRSVPGMEGFLRRRDLPSFGRMARDLNDSALQFALTVTRDVVTRARGLIFNTPEFLEEPVLATIRSHCPNIYALGPLHSLLRSYHGGRLASNSSISASMWEEDKSCMAWLDAQQKGSVVYVSFGSLTVMSKEELQEFRQGLLNSGYPFLWVLRPGIEKEMGSLPPPAEEEKDDQVTWERGLVVPWAPQEEVLSHPAVGCFLTHSGWNSTLESIVCGVPMICWPFFADQQINSRYVSEVWGVGVDMKDRCGRGTVEGMVREVMEGKRAEGMRRSVAEKGEMARRSIREGGSSYRDLLKLVGDIKSLSLPELTN